MNLLPTEEKVKFKKSYRLKILLVGLFLFAGVLILAIAPIVASYFLISYKIDASGRELAAVRPPPPTPAHEARSRAPRARAVNAGTSRGLA